MRPLLCCLCLLLACSQPPPSEGDRLYEAGLMHLRAGRWQQAAAAFQRLIQINPYHQTARVRLGEAFVRQGRPRDAARLLDELSPQTRLLPEARLLEARLLAFKGEALEAEERAEAVLAEHPASADARLLLAQLHLQAAATMNLRRAAQFCRQVLEEHPEHLDAGLMLLQAELRLGNFSAARAQGERLSRLYPEDSQVQIQAGTAALWSGDKSAVQTLCRAVDLSLDRHTDRLKALWLLKLAYERQGSPPADLEERYRFHAYQPAAAPSGLRFTDVAKSAGVDKVDRGRGSAWLDFDLDGDWDLFSVGIQVEHALYRNDGDGTFADVTRPFALADARGGWGASTADYDNDGDPDLYVTRDAWEGPAPNSLYRNDGSRFADVAESAGALSPGASFTAAWADYDGNGYADLYVANGVVGDGGRNALYRNDGDRFADVAAALGTDDPSKTIGTAWGDYDNDGDPDLYVVNIGQPNRLYRNDGERFADVARQAGVLFPIEGGYVTFFFDFDNDGHLDLFAATMSAFEDVLNSMVEGRAIDPNRPFLYRNRGDGTFADLTQVAGMARSFGSMGIGVGDVDNDGFGDIYLANGGPQMYRLEPNTLFHNRRDGTFADVTEEAGVGNLGKGHGATFADYDRDGDLDLYAGLGGHYDADVWPNALYRNDSQVGHWLAVDLQGAPLIGARATLESGAHRVHAEVASGFGFGSSNALSLHLGLGAQTRVDRLHIRWPSGRLQTWENLPADRRLHLREGAATPSPAR